MAVLASGAGAWLVSPLFMSLVARRGALRRA
jgi:hypothetical protein